MRSRLCACAGLATVVAACGLLATFGAGPARANVYATDLKFSSPAVNATSGSATVDLSFRLNEPADTGVTLAIFRADTNAKVREIALGAKPRGQATWTWDLKDDGGTAVPKGLEYYFKVTASDDGHAKWDQINFDTDQQCKLPTAWSVAVNKDPNSQYFGRVYATNSYTGDTSVPPAPQRTCDHGLYALNADMSDALGQGDAPITGGVDWSDRWLGPSTVKVGDDGKVYVSCNSDGLSGTWVAPGDLSGNWTALLDPSNVSNYLPYAACPPAIHGSPTGAFVAGKGVNRYLYWVDEDLMVPGDDPNGAKSNMSIWRFWVGPIDHMLTNSPEIFWSDFPNNYMQDFGDGNFCDLAKDKTGNFFISQYSWHGAGLPSLLKIAPDGNAANNYAPLWNAAIAYGNSDPLDMNCKGVAVDDAHDRLFTVGTWGIRNNWDAPGEIRVVTKSTMDLNSVVRIPMNAPEGNLPHPRGMDVDAVGNIYVTDHSIELLHVYSPADGPNSYTTKSYGRFVAANGDATKPATPVITVPATTADSSKLSASWTATGASYRYAISVTPDDQGEYAVNWTATASNNVTATGLNLRNNTTYYWYVQAKSASGVWSDVAVSSGTLVARPMTLGEAKELPVGTDVSLANLIVTKTASDQFQAQDVIPLAGARFISTANPAEGAIISVTGTVSASGPEKTITVKTITVTGSATPKPLGIRASQAGGAPFKGNNGVASDGMLVTVTGKISGWDMQNMYIYVDDGSEAKNDTPAGSVTSVVPGIKAGPTSQAFVNPVEYYKVTGIVRFDVAPGGGYIPRIEPIQDGAPYIELIAP